MKTELRSFFFWVLMSISFGTATAQVSNIRADLSAPGRITVTYDLVVCYPVDVTLYYSPDKCDWFEATKVTGALTSQATGNNKAIVWNNYDDNVRFGKFYFKVEATDTDMVSANPEAEVVVINGVKWANKNLATGGWFVANDYDYGALYQWGRQTDGHECRTSPVHSGVVSTNLDATTGQVTSSSPAYGKFIAIGDYSSIDWRTPKNDKLWNDGTEASPVKTVNDPCPQGWRVPTQAELAKLQALPVANKVWTTNYQGSGINGYLITDNVNFSASIFLPAAGARAGSLGSLVDVGSEGDYWSSGPNGELVYGLTFKSSWTAMGSMFREIGCSVRCVSEQ